MYNSQSHKFPNFKCNIPAERPPSLRARPTAQYLRSNLMNSRHSSWKLEKQTDKRATIQPPSSRRCPYHREQRLGCTVCRQLELDSRYTQNRSRASHVVAVYIACVESRSQRITASKVRSFGCPRPAPRFPCAASTEPSHQDWRSRTDALFARQKRSKSRSAVA